MRVWIRRILLTLALLVVVGIAYAGWRFGHPPMPADTRTLASGTVPAGDVTLVVPIHWDDFLLPLGDFQPLRRFLDDIPLTMSRLTPLAARDGVEIRYMPVIVPVDINAAKGK